MIWPLLSARLGEPPRATEGHLQAVSAPAGLSYASKMDSNVGGLLLCGI
jgi:hypothetical protein